MTVAFLLTCLARPGEAAFSCILSDQTDGRMHDLGDPLTGSLDLALPKKLSQIRVLRHVNNSVPRPVESLPQFCHPDSKFGDGISGGRA
jgi:hypothetical protein